MHAYIVSVGRRAREVVVHEAGESLRVEMEGSAYRVELSPWLGTTHFRLRVDGSPHTAVIRRQADVLLVTIDDDQFRLQVSRKLPIVRKVDAQISRTRVAEIAAPMPGLIVSVDVAAGEAIGQGQAVAVLEAMKMQMEIRAPAAGRVKAVHVQPGQEVGGGTIVVTLESA